jgi:D-alanyl-D-alanine carboxypeptidase
VSNEDMYAKLSTIVEKFRRRSKYGSIVMHMESVDGSFVWSHGIGAESSIRSQTIGTASPFFIASATKLFVTAVVLQLVREGRLDLDQPIVDVVTRANLVGLHRLNGRDHTRAITARQLLSHTSGLANYLEDRATDDTRLLHNVLKANGDRRWSRADIYEWHRTKFEAVFEPGADRAHYSDTNFHLLAELVEHVEGAEFDVVFRKRISDPLGLSGTSMFGTPAAPNYDDVATMFTGALPATIPLAMASVREDGGMVSTTRDCVTFLRSLVDGSLVGHNPFVDQTWRRVFFPLEYGLGVMRINIPRFMSPFGKPPVLYGHGGASGTVLFYDPASSLMIAGTVNQIERRNKPYQLMLHLIQAARQR